MRANRLKQSQRIVAWAFCAALALSCEDQRPEGLESGTEPASSSSSSAITSPNPSQKPSAGENGRWIETPSTAQEQPDAGLIEQLLSIGYLQGSRETRTSGVTLHDTARAQRGINLYASGHAPEAVLMDMDGEVLHRWALPYESAFEALPRPNTNADWWRRVALFENGDLLAIYEGLGLVKIDKDSNVIWSSDLKTHHDLEVQNNGDIYVLTRKARQLPRIHPSTPILEDFVSILSPQGDLKAEFSLLEAFENSRFANLIDGEIARDHGDIFHTNTIAVLDGSIAARDRAFGAGNFLTSMNRLGVVAVVSPRLGQVIWVRRTAPVGQHDPKILPNGNMLLFTNYKNGESSAVEEFDPVGGKVRWSYRGTEEHPFYSKYLGTAERLTNGNTLITESDGGRAFEITPDGEKVWEFYNPNRAGDEDQFIATLPELIRLPLDYPIGWATGARLPGS
jgi:hypothetical protein